MYQGFEPHLHPCHSLLLGSGQECGGLSKGVAFRKIAVGGGQCQSSVPVFGDDSFASSLVEAKGSTQLKSQEDQGPKANEPCKEIWELTCEEQTSSFMMFFFSAKTCLPSYLMCMHASIQNYIGIKIHREYRVIVPTCECILDKSQDASN